MKVYRNKIELRRVSVVQRCRIRKVLRVEPNAGLSWDLDFKGVDYDI